MVYFERNIGDDMYSWEILANPRATIEQIEEIAGSSYYAETTQEQAMWRIINMRSGTPGRDKALATVVSASGYKKPPVREAAARAILASTTAGNEHLLPIAVRCTGELQEQAVRKMIANGGITDAQLRVLETHAPQYMGVEDDEGKRFRRTIQAVLMP